MMLYPIMYYVLWNGIVTIIKVTKPVERKFNTIISSFKTNDPALILPTESTRVETQS